MTELLEVMTGFLWIGGRIHAGDKSLLRSLKVTDIINCSRAIDFFPKDFNYLHPDMATLKATSRNPSELTLLVLSKTITQLQQSEQARILLHDDTGKGDAMCVFLAFLVYINGWSLHKSLQFILEREPDTEVSRRLWGCLADFEILQIGSQSLEEVVTLMKKREAARQAEVKDDSKDDDAAVAARLAYLDKQRDRERRQFWTRAEHLEVVEENKLKAQQEREAQERIHATALGHQKTKAQRDMQLLLDQANQAKEDEIDTIRSESALEVRKAKLKMEQTLADKQKKVDELIWEKTSLTNRVAFLENRPVALQLAHNAKDSLQLLLASAQDMVGDETKERVAGLIENTTKKIEQLENKLDGYDDEKLRKAELIALIAERSSSLAKLQDPDQSQQEDNQAVLQMTISTFENNLKEYNEELANQNGHSELAILMANCAEQIEDEKKRLSDLEQQFEAIPPTGKEILLEDLSEMMKTISDAIDHYKAVRDGNPSEDEIKLEDETLRSLGIRIDTNSKRQVVQYLNLERTSVITRIHNYQKERALFLAERARQQDEDASKSNQQAQVGDDEEGQKTSEDEDRDGDGSVIEQLEMKSKADEEGKYSRNVAAGDDEEEDEDEDGPELVIVCPQDQILVELNERLVRLNESIRKTLTNARTFDLERALTWVSGAIAGMIQMSSFGTPEYDPIKIVADAEDYALLFGSIWRVLDKDCNGFIQDDVLNMLLDQDDDSQQAKLLRQAVPANVFNAVKACSQRVSQVLFPHVAAWTVLDKFSAPVVLFPPTDQSQSPWAVPFLIEDSKKKESPDDGDGDGDVGDNEEKHSHSPLSPEFAAEMRLWLAQKCSESQAKIEYDRVTAKLAEAKQDLLDQKKANLVEIDDLHKKYQEQMSGSAGTLIQENGKLKHQVAKLKKQKEKLQNELETTEEDYENEMDQLRNEHQTAILDMESKFKKELNEMKMKLISSSNTAGIQLEDSGSDDDDHNFQQLRKVKKQARKLQGDLDQANAELEHAKKEIAKLRGHLENAAAGKAIPASAFVSSPMRSFRSTSSSSTSSTSSTSSSRSHTPHHQPNGVNGQVKSDHDEDKTEDGTSGMNGSADSSQTPGVVHDAEARREDDESTDNFESKYVDEDDGTNLDPVHRAAALSKTGAFGSVMGRAVGRILRPKVRRVVQAEHSSYQVGDRVTTGGNNGTVRFFGTAKFAKGLWVGIELDEALGKHDGSIQGEKYFEAQPNHGVFVKPSAVDHI